MFVIVVIGLRELRESGDRRLAEKIGLDAVENIRRVKTRSGRVLCSSATASNRTACDQGI